MRRTLVLCICMATIINIGYGQSEKIELLTPEILPKAKVLYSPAIILPEEISELDINSEIKLYSHSKEVYLLSTFTDPVCISITFYGEFHQKYHTQLNPNEKLYLTIPQYLLMPGIYYAVITSAHSSEGKYSFEEWLKIKLD